MRSTPAFQPTFNEFMPTFSGGAKRVWGTQFSEGGARMTWGQELHSTIERRDATALRRMADESRKEETRLFLNLLAGMIEQQPNQGTQLKRTASG